MNCPAAPAAGRRGGILFADAALSTIMASRPKAPSRTAGPPEPTALGAASPQLDAILSELQALNRRVDQLIGAVTDRALGGDGAEYPPGRDRDPGDAVPPGVAVQSPVPLAPGDKSVLRELERLPKRAPRRKPRPD